MKQYLDLLHDVYHNGFDRVNGTDKEDRAYQEWLTASSTRWVFWRQIRMNLEDGFPLLTTKKVFHKAIVHELLWLLSGSSNIQYLCKNGVRIWDDWPYDTYKKSESFQWETIKEFSEKIANDDDFAQQWWDLGPVYGQQRRKWPTQDGGTIDQIQKAIEKLQNNPYSRRIIVNAWNAAYVEKMALPPCHTMFQFYVANGKLSCQLFQRSADIFLWVPFNIASYALLTHMFAQVTWLKVGEFVHTFGDVHVYDNQYKQVETQLGRTPRWLPTLWLNPAITDIDDFTFDDIKIEGYDPHPPIKANVVL